MRVHTCCSPAQWVEYWLERLQSYIINYQRVAGPSPFTALLLPAGRIRNVMKKQTSSIFHEGRVKNSLIYSTGNNLEPVIISDVNASTLVK